jgi:hypothetical protein
MTLKAARTIAFGVCVGLLAAGPRPCDAQVIRYAYRGGDTVRFIETMDVNGISTQRGGTLSIALARAAKVSLAFAATDTVKAWYDSLAMRSTSPAGIRHAETQSVLRVPFLLRVRSDGHARTLLTPALPDIVRQLAEFYPPFDDFLPMLPPDTTGAGATRTDTIQQRETLGDRRITMRRVVWSRFDRDTVIGDKPAHVLSIRTTLRVEVSSGSAAADFTTNLVLEGHENGEAVVSRAGALLWRSRKGEARGTTMYKGRGAEVSVPQTYTYSSVIRAVGK